MPIATRDCEQCGKTFSYYPSANPSRRFCSMACRLAHGQNGKAIQTCPQCSKQFAYQLSWPRKYCSLTCRAKALGLQQKTKVSIACDQCGNRFEKTKSQVEKVAHNFCSQTCFGKWQSENVRGTVHPNYKPKIKCTCKQCRKVFEIYPSWVKSNGGQFCSQACKKLYLAGDKHHGWKGGHLPYYGPNWSGQRRNARRRDNYTCQRCGKTEQQLGRHLDVHHLKPFRSFGLKRHLEANRLANLISLCSHCHTQVERGR